MYSTSFGPQKASGLVVILIVEDDGFINLLVSDDLQRAGYDVVSVYSADEAIRVLESRNDIC